MTRHVILKIFEKLMAMDDESFVARWKRRSKPKEILATLSIARIADYFSVEPDGVLPVAAPVDWSKSEYDTVKVPGVRPHRVGVVG